MNTRVAGTGVPDTAAGPAPGVAVHTPPPGVKVPPSFLGATGGGHIPPPGVKVPPSVLSAGGQPLAEEILRVKDGVATLTHVDNALPADYEKRLNTLTVAKEQQVSLGRGVLESGTRTVAEKKETILGNVLTATTSASTFDELSHQQKMIREIQANDLKMYDDMIAQKRKEGVRPEVIAELEKRRYWTEKDMWNRQKIVAGLQGAAPPPAPPPPASLDPADYGKMTIYPEIDGAAAVMSSTASLRDMETPLAAMTGDAQLSTSALQSMVAGWQEQTTARVNAAHGLIALNTAKDRISEETDNKIREAENQKQQAHQAAIKTVRDAANSRANDQVANSWGTKVGDALIVDGLTAGGKNFGSTFGTSAATHVGTRLFPTKPASSGNTTGSGGGTASGGSSGGGTGWSSAPSSGGHGGGGGDDHHGGGGGGNSGGGGPDVVNTQNNGDGTITVTYSCGNTWTGKPPAPPKCPKCNEGTLASGTPSGGANTNITMTVEGYDLTCSECGKVTKILKSQAIPKQCPYCGDVKPQGGTVMGSGPAVTMTTNITSGGAGSKELYNAGRGMIQCSYCGRNWYCSSCAANASNSNVREKHAHICPYCNNRKNTGVQPNSGDGLIDAFCPIHRIKYGGRIRDNPKCPQCEAEKNQVWDAMCPNGHGKYGGRGPVTGCPRCAQIYGPGFIR
ncbi:MAG: hypothetical protein NTV49_04350 [Kiritimatiellaeota bacterium]|nr:hypothetical protein [Kiritimatiellota bacterium]